MTFHAILGLIQISRYGYFHGTGRENEKNDWNVREISPTRREHAVKKVTATVKHYTKSLAGANSRREFFTP